MRRFLTLCLCLLCLSGTAVASATLSFQTDGQLVSPRAMALSGNGDLFVVGSLWDQSGVFGDPLGEGDAFFLRVDRAGHILWQARHGGSLTDGFSLIAPTKDGGCLVVGSTLSTDFDGRNNRGGADILCVRYAADGTVLFVKLLGGFQDDEALAVIEAENGDFLLAGRTKSRNGDFVANLGGWDAFAMRLDAATGKPLWVYRLGQRGDDRFTHIMPTDDGWLFLGEIANATDADESGWVYVPTAVALDAEGKEQWNVPLTDVAYAAVNAVVPQEGGGWLLTGAMVPAPERGSDVWVLSLRPNGIIAWQRTYGGSEQDAALAITPSETGTLLLATTSSQGGNAIGTHGGQDLWVLRLSQTGILSWAQAIGGSKDERALLLTPLGTGGWLAVGATFSQDGDFASENDSLVPFMARLSAMGNLVGISTLQEEPIPVLNSAIASKDTLYLLGTTDDQKAFWLSIVPLQ